MLDVIHKNFEERLSGFLHDVFAREEIQAVGISSCVYGFSIKSAMMIHILLSQSIKNHETQGHSS